ncbi:hypothetical protein J6590_017288 [Homalodisca vitripennis]|nr:hypothetical protein J6590_017288 [Homalodisca vitripennis]
MKQRTADGKLPTPALLRTVPRTNVTTFPCQTTFLIHTITHSLSVLDSPLCSPSSYDTFLLPQILQPTFLVYHECTRGFSLLVGHRLGLIRQNKGELMQFKVKGEKHYGLLSSSDLNSYVLDRSAIGTPKGYTSMSDRRLQYNIP